MKRLSLSGDGQSLGPWRGAKQQAVGSHEPEKPLYPPRFDLSKASHGHDQILNQSPLEMDVIYPKRIFKALEGYKKSEALRKPKFSCSFLPRQGGPPPIFETRSGGRICGSSNICHLVRFSPECFPPKILSNIKSRLKKNFIWFILR